MGGKDRGSHGAGEQLCLLLSGQCCSAQLIYRAVPVGMALLELYRSTGKELDLPPVDPVGIRCVLSSV